MLPRLRRRSILSEEKMNAKAGVRGEKTYQDSAPVNVGIYRGHSTWPSAAHIYLPRFKATSMIMS
jgi:hypothetical protein